MGLGDKLRSMAGRGQAGEGELRLTPEARSAVADALAGRDGDLVFRVQTVPHELGFAVKVGYEAPDPAVPAHPAFGEFALHITEADRERLAGYTIDVREGRFVTFTDVRVHVSPTPNPDSRKFLVSRPVIVSGTATFVPPVADDAPALVRLLAAIDGVARVFLADAFVSITREPGVDFEDLSLEVGRAIQTYFAHGGEPVPAMPRAESDLDDVESRIVRLLEETVRPRVQEDGGDILYAGFEDGVVKLHMVGSCDGCPSSTATLKMGIESLLREEVPEVEAVEAI